MKGILFLAWRYLAFHKLRTFILVTCITITLVLPAAVHLLIHHYHRDMMARAEATPLVVGAKGNRYDLVMGALYFRTEELTPVTMGEVRRIRDGGLGLAIPLHVRFTARDYSVVGTTVDYFEFRGLKVSSGTLPAVLGDAVLGARVARELKLAPGGAILSDQRNLYDISTTYPLNMRVCGVLAETRTPDDYAVFVDVKTAWVIEGRGHGHADLIKRIRPEVEIERTKDKVVASEAIEKYAEITPDNIGSFHFHGDLDNFPLSLILVVPNDAKSSTMLKGQYHVSKTMQMLVPTRVVEELMGIVLKVKRFFDMNFALVAASTGLFLVLVVWLSVRIRRGEMATMHKIGCSRMTVFWLQAGEMMMIFVTSVLLTGLLTWVMMLLAPRFVHVS